MANLFLSYSHKNEELETHLATLKREGLISARSFSMPSAIATIRRCPISAARTSNPTATFPTKRSAASATGSPSIECETRNRCPAPRHCRQTTVASRREIGALMAPRRLDTDDLTHTDFLFAVNDWFNVTGTAA